MSFFESETQAEEFKHQLLGEYEGEYDVLIAFIDVFSRKIFELTTEARAAYGQKKTQDFIRHVHSLKGSISQLYVQDLKKLAQKIEDEVRADGLTLVAFKDFERLERELESFAEWLVANFLGQH